VSMHDYHHHHDTPLVLLMLTKSFVSLGVYRDGCDIGYARCQPGYYCALGSMTICPQGTWRDLSYNHVQACYPCEKVCGWLARCGRACLEGKTEACKGRTFFLMIPCGRPVTLVSYLIRGVIEA